MDKQTLIWLLSTAGTIIGILIAMNGFWVKRLIRTIDKLDNTVENLDKLVTVQKKEFETFKQTCDLTHRNINKRLAVHGNRLDKHQESIAVLNERTTKEA